MKTTAGYRLIVEPACTNVCFWYIPPSLRGQEETKEWWGKLGKVSGDYLLNLMLRLVSVKVKKVQLHSKTDCMNAV